MLIDEKILNDILEEYPPDYAYLIRQFFLTHEKIDGCWVSTALAPPTPDLYAATSEGSREAGLPTLKAEAAWRSRQSKPEGPTDKKALQ